MTRAELAKIATVVSNADLSLSGGGLFSDTPEGYWANSYINSAAQQKLIFGYPDGSFRPEATANLCRNCHNFTAAVRLWHSRARQPLSRRLY